RSPTARTIAARTEAAAQRRRQDRPQRSGRHDLLVRARPLECARQTGVGARKVNKSRKRHLRPQKSPSHPVAGQPEAPESQ
ncbi:hypothetical protein, partial [Actinomadura darangshiensis]|uniref:hypothetical protein n=1 Tax=Actinomadura darangshiensis TaxID=705336 RepID=UPI001A9EB0F3